MAMAGVCSEIWRATRDVTTLMVMTAARRFACACVVATRHDQHENGGAEARRLLYIWGSRAVDKLYASWC